MIDKITPQIAALYLGQKCEPTGKDSIFLAAYYGDGSLVPIIPNFVQEIANDRCEVILHLRRLESITEEEARELYKIENHEAWNTQKYSQGEHLNGSCLDKWWNTLLEDVYIQNSAFSIGNPAVWLYLLSKGFDLFGLINAGLAKEI